MTTGLVVGGVTIPVAASSVSRQRMDATDRTRALDNTYRASFTGNPKRDFHFQTPPVTRTSANLYELTLAKTEALGCSGDVVGSSSNFLTYSSQFSNPIWVLTTATVTSGITDPFGGTEAATVTATAGAAFIEQDLAAGVSEAITNSIYAKRRTGVGVVSLRDATGADHTIALTGSWTRFTNVVTTTLRQFAIRITTNGDALDIAAAQMENADPATDYIQTLTAAIQTPLPCYPEITGWTPVVTAQGHSVVIDFILHEQ